MSIQRQLTNERMSQIVVHSGTVATPAAAATGAPAATATGSVDQRELCGGGGDDE